MPTVAYGPKHLHTSSVDKAFTLRLLRCFLFGLGAFVIILALDITIRSPFDVAAYILGAGGLWYVVELLARPQPKPKAEVRPPGPPPSQKETKAKAKPNPLGEDHFD